MQSLADYLNSGSKPQLISWGIHEGMRGATWIQLQESGRLTENRYTPDGPLEGETTELGMLSAERFDELLELLLGIPDRYLVDDNSLDPHAQITLDCIAEDCGWNWAFPPWEIENDKALSNVAQVFRALREALPENGEDGQAD